MFEQRTNTAADWIGSGSHFDDPKHDCRPRIDEAIDNAGFLRNPRPASRLPTHFAADEIHYRTANFPDLTLATNSPRRGSLPSHANVWLKATEPSLARRPGKSWLDCGQRGVLATFAVAVIALTLSAMMNVNHVFGRTFGPVGKMLISDETARRVCASPRCWTAARWLLWTAVRPRKGTP